jgi:AcrR family transcriptional regulator
MTTPNPSGTSTGEAAADATATGRHLRADARRNRDRILQAADALVAVQGIEASIDDIAAAAGVGVGTMYRNFPTKEALLEALLVARMEPLLAAARTAADSDDPGEAFVAFVRRVSDEVVNLHALAEAMVSEGIDFSATKQKVSAELGSAVEILLQRAQQAGRVRPDVGVADLSAMMGGLAHADPSLMDPSQRSRCVALVCDSLLLDARSLLPRKTPDTVPAGP